MQGRSLIVVDDCEDEESVMTELQRKKTLKWLVSAVRPALPRNDPDAYIQILGTMLHPDCMLAQAEPGSDSYHDQVWLD